VLVRPRDLPGASLDVRLREAVLTTRLQHATLLVTAADLGLGEGPPAGVTLDLCRLLARSPIRSILALRPGQGSALPLDGTDRERITVERPGVQRRTALWAEELSALGVAADREEVATVAAMFSLGPTQIRAAARAAAREGAPGLGELTRAARERSTSPLEGIAEWVPALYEWDDLVLPPATLRRVTELAGAVRHRHQVFDGWSFGRLSGGHASVRALFSGPSGTGKTMSASVVARDLGLDLYRIDLSAVVSKYVGETEKNLERVLAAAEESNAVLLFDEADALFGKRTEVKDAHDRYANIETAFLLQRLESFDGVVILATNLAGNLDDAFSRRIHFHVEFPMPDQALRADLWRKALPKTAPVDGDVDPEFLAGMFPLSGGDIRSATLTAAFMAAGEGGPIGMRQLVKALARHRRQQGKVPSVAEFRQYLRVACDEDG
jgi:predicted nucleic acid-binding protein